jgi:hypothetical protein
VALKAQQATGCTQITAVADRGYFNGDQVLSCEDTGSRRTFWIRFACRRLRISTIGFDPTLAAHLRMPSIRSRVHFS